MSSSSSSSNAGSSPWSSLAPRILDVDGTSVISPESLAERLDKKRVAYYFAAGWCPMCTSFEPALVQFRQAALDSQKPVQLIYVPSDRTPTDASKRASAMGMWSVPHGVEADALKKSFKIWSGAESMKLGFGRRSGVPALVVLDTDGAEMTFIEAESKGVQSLSAWPLNDEKGVWGLPK
eukprot:scaffold28114_cov53-Attheya_sp.AAC.5